MFYLECFLAISGYFAPIYRLSVPLSMNVFLNRSAFILPKTPIPPATNPFTYCERRSRYVTTFLMTLTFKTIRLGGYSKWN